MVTRVFYDSHLTYYADRCRTFCRITMALKETAGLYETLKAEWNKKNPNLSKCGELLSKLKVESHTDVFAMISKVEPGTLLIKEALALLANVAKLAKLVRLTLCVEFYVWQISDTYSLSIFRLIMLRCQRVGDKTIHSFRIFVRTVKKTNHYSQCC